jgi:hypothetical protein
MSTAEREVVEHKEGNLGSTKVCNTPGQCSAMKRIHCVTSADRGSHKIVFTLSLGIERFVVRICHRICQVSSSCVQLSVGVM